MMGDRRKPVSRYVLFTDQATQDRFAGIAEAAYQDIARLDQWAGLATLELPGVPTAAAAPTRRGLLRRSVADQAPPSETFAVTGGLSAAGEVGRDVPARIEAFRGCAAERMLAATMGRVVLDLVRDLAAAPVGEQRDHPAYRQTLRLAAELRALQTMLTDVGCQSPFGCVQPRQPEQWGRREEDVEVDEVRSVLLEIAADIATHRT